MNDCTPIHHDIHTAIDIEMHTYSYQLFQYIPVSSVHEYALTMSGNDSKVTISGNRITYIDRCKQRCCTVDIFEGLKWFKIFLKIFFY